MPPRPLTSPRWPARLLALFSLLGLGMAPVDPLAGVRSWGVYYGAEATLAQLQGPDLLVLEPDHPWQPARIRRPGQRILAYLSLGEVHRSRPYFKQLTPSALVEHNPDWEGAVRVDPRSPAWRSLVLDQLAGAMMAKGYDGFFLDTLDVGAYLEQRGRHPGATAAMAELVGALKARYPRALIVANGGLDLLPQAAPALSAIAVESVLTDYDFQARRYRMRDAAGAAERAQRLWALGDRHRLPLLVLEYVDPRDAEARSAVAAAVAAVGFVPFVSDIGLESLPDTQGAYGR